MGIPPEVREGLVKFGIVLNQNHKDVNKCRPNTWTGKVRYIIF